MHKYRTITYTWVGPASGAVPGTECEYRESPYSIIARARMGPVQSTLDNIPRGSFRRRRNFAASGNYGYWGREAPPPQNGGPPKERSDDGARLGLAGRGGAEFWSLQATLEAFFLHKLLV